MVAAADLLTPTVDVPVLPLVVAPLLPAAGGLLIATVAISVVSLATAVAMTAAQGDLGTPEALIRLVSFALICLLAVIGTRLRRRVDELVQALDALPDAVTIQDAGGVVLYGNQAASRLTGEPDGVSRDAAAAYLARMVVTDEQGAPLDPSTMPAQQLIAGHEAHPAVIRSLDPADGRVSWTRVQASPLRDAEGRVRSAVNVIEDITEVKLAEERAAFMADAGALLGSSLDTALTLQRTARLAVPGLADWCAIDLLDAGGRPELVALAHVDAAKVSLGHELRRRYPPDLDRAEGIGGVLRTGRSQLFADVSSELLAASAEDEEHRLLLESIGFASALIVPLAIGQRVFGALTWVTAESRRRYGPADLQTAEELASRAAVAVENARVHTARVEISTVLQQALLPSALPDAPGWELAAHFRAAGEANQVGGDFYDVVELGDGALLALVGDVAGKGARAAALTARTRHTLVAAAALVDGDPAGGLTWLNAALQADGDFELCSVVVLVLRGAQMTVVSAGHPLPLLLRDGVLCEVGVTSPMLGAAPPDQGWTPTTVLVAPDDLVMLYTDGVPDAVGRTERFGDTRLHAALREGPAAAQPAIDRVEQRLDAFEHGPQADDRAMLALRRLA